MPTLRPSGPTHSARAIAAPVLLVALLAGLPGGCGRTTTALPQVAGPSTFINETDDLADLSLSPDRPTSTPIAPTISEVRDWSDRFDDNPSSYQDALGFVRVLMAAGSVERAIEVSQDALTHHPGDSQLLFIQAQAHLQNGAAGLALRALDAASGAGVADWRHLSLRGICLDQLDEHERAQKAYQRALRLSPGNAKIYNNLGLSHALSGNPEQAEAVLRKAMSLDGSSVQIRQNLALVLGAQGKFAEAERLSAEDLKPNQVRDNLDYYRWLLTPRRTWDELGDTPGSGAQPKN